MSRGPSVKPGCRMRFPRVSGDEPGLAKETGLTNLFSPRERG